VDRTPRTVSVNYAGRYCISSHSTGGSPSPSRSFWLSLEFVLRVSPCVAGWNVYRDSGTGNSVRDGAARPRQRVGSRMGSPSCWKRAVSLCRSCAIFRPDLCFSSLRERPRWRRPNMAGPSTSVCKHMPYRLWLARPDLTLAMDFWKGEWNHHQASPVWRRPIHGKSLFQVNRSIMKSHTYMYIQIHKYTPSCISHANPNRPDRCNSMNMFLGFRTNRRGTVTVMCCGRGPIVVLTSHGNVACPPPAAAQHSNRKQLHRGRVCAHCTFVVRWPRAQRA
jgi:hypothetical protein